MKTMEQDFREDVKARLVEWNRRENDFWSSVRRDDNQAVTAEAPILPKYERVTMRKSAGLTNLIRSFLP